jgi:hypothetical protein
MASMAFRHHSTFERYEVGFDCFWREKSEYRPCKRARDVVEKGGSVEMDVENAAEVDIMGTDERAPELGLG